jgi:hypothetical protein
MSFTEKLQILISADAGGAVKEFKKLGNAADKDLGKATGSIDRMSSKMVSLGSGAVVGAVALGAGLASMAMDAADAEQQQLKLTNSIKNSDQVYAGNGKALREQASAIMKVTGADDDAIVSAQALLVQFGRTSDETQKLTPLVVDLSRKLGIDLDVAAKAVGKSSEGSYGALSKMGIAVTDLGGGASATDNTVAALAATVGGFAEEQGKTFAGSLEIAKAKFGELKESIGGGVLDVVNPLLNIATAAGDISPAAGEAAGKIGAIGAIGAGLVGSLSVGTGAVMKMRDNFTTMSGEGENATRKLSKVGKAAGAIAAVGAAVAIFEIANALNDATFDAEKFELALTKLKTGATTTGKVSAQSFNDLAESTTKVGDKLIDFVSGTNSFNINGVTTQFDDARRALDLLKDSGDTELLQKNLNLLSQAKIAPDAPEKVKLMFEAFKQDLAGYQTQIDETAKSTQASAQATLGLSEEIVGAGDAVALTEEALKKYDAQLTLSTVNQDGAAAAAQGFADALENTTILDDVIAGASTLGTTMRTFGTDIAALPKDINLTKLALGQYTEEQQKSIDALVDAGEANSSYLAGLVEQGASADTVRGKADELRFSYGLQAKQLGLNDEQTEAYLSTLGLTPKQVDTAIKLSGDADARFRIEAYQTLIAATPPDKLTTYYAAISKGDFIGAAGELNKLAANRTVKVYPEVINPGGFVGQLLSGGGRDNNIFTPMAKGGRVGNQTYQVNEKGPELFTPSSSGFIMNAGDTEQMLRGVSTLIAGGGRGASQVNVTVPVTFAGPVAQDSVRWVTDTITKAARTGILSSGVLSGAGR